MRRIPARIIKWLAGLFGFKIVMIKLRKEHLIVEGHPEIFEYFDGDSYYYSKYPFPEYDEDMVDWDITLLDGLEEE